MTSLPVTQARSKLYQLMDEAADSHEPIQITGKRSNAVLVSEEDWRRDMETNLYGAFYLAQAAFEALVALSQRRHVKLHDVAQKLVDGAARRPTRRAPEA